MWPITTSFAHRRRQPEIMDQPGLDVPSHVQALQGLARINRWSGSARILWPGLKEAARLVHPRPLSVLDVATGAGDIPIQIAGKAKAAGLAMEISACDRSGTALSHAREAAARADASISYFEWDVLAKPLPGKHDVVMCSLFLHHLSEDETVSVLKNMSQSARHLLLINDLRRSAPGWWLAYLGTRILSTSPVVRFDGPVSVAGAYTRREILQLACRAGLRDARAMRRWPCRFLLTWWNLET